MYKSTAALTQRGFYNLCVLLSNSWFVFPNLLKRIKMLKKEITIS